MSRSPLKIRRIIRTVFFLTSKPRHRAYPMNWMSPLLSSLRMSEYMARHFLRGSARSGRLPIPRAQHSSATFLGTSLK